MSHATYPTLKNHQSRAKWHKRRDLKGSISSTLFALLCSAIFATMLSSGNSVTAYVVQSERCLKNAFPVISGGERDEEVKCLVFDPVNEFFIVGGKTLSNDYGPSLSRHGFLYAIDLEGNWAWGRFYYNSSAINDISGCTLSTDGKKVVALGVGLSQPVMMVLNTTDGSIDYLASL